jgi:hypothetical protein
MPQIDGMSAETLVKFLKGMTIRYVWFYNDPQALHLTIGEERGPSTALLTMTVMDDGVLKIGLQGMSDCVRESEEAE